jgi:hypothetical protein
VSSSNTFRIHTNYQNSGVIHSLPGPHVFDVLVGSCGKEIYKFCQWSQELVTGFELVRKLSPWKSCLFS